MNETQFIKSENIKTENLYKDSEPQYPAELGINSCFQTLK